LGHDNSIYLLSQEVKKTGTFFKGTCCKRIAGLVRVGDPDLE